MRMILIKYFFIIIAINLTFYAQGQNLVVNGYFESYTICPNYVSQVDRATGWIQPTDATPDYLNSCLGVPFSVSVPDNQFGIQAAKSGNGYAGLYAFFSFGIFTTVPDEDREYITHALSQPLTPGESYYTEFYVSLSEASKYAVDDLGLLFSTIQPSRLMN